MNKAIITRQPILIGVNEISIEIEYKGTKYRGCLSEVQQDD